MPLPMSAGLFTTFTPAAVSAHAWYQPAVMETNFRPPLTGTGCGTLPVSVVPRLAESASPQQYATPSVGMPQVRRRLVAPVETARRPPPGAAGVSGVEGLGSRCRQHGGWWPASPGEGTAPQPAAPAAVEVPAPQFEGDPGEYPYYLHLYLSDLLSDGRGANQTWLQGSPDPMTTISWQTWVELHPSTAQKLGLQDGDVVKVTSPYGEIEAAIYTYPGVRPDTVAIPLGQGHTDLGRYARNRGSNPIQLAGSQPGDANLNWSTLRVQLSATGKNVAVAHFEDKVGVTQGFINQAFPGQ